jgi:hypothetical protein
MNNKVLFGFLGGFAAMALLASLYVTNKEFLLAGYEKFTWLLIIGAMSVAVIRQRSEEEYQFIGFYEAMKTAFQTFMLAYLIKFLFTYVLFNFIDPSLLEIAKEKAVEIFIAHKNPEETEKIFEQRLEAFKDGYFGPSLFEIGLMLEIIVGFVFSAIIAFFLKREKPEY